MHVVWRRDDAACTLAWNEMTERTLMRFDSQAENRCEQLQAELHKALAEPKFDPSMPRCVLLFLSCCTRPDTGYIWVFFNT
jgi:hypothetical protein